MLASLPPRGRHVILLTVPPGSVILLFDGPKSRRDIFSRRTTCSFILFVPSEIRMSKSRMENELELGSFGDHLLKGRIVPEKHAPYYVGWVRRFLSRTPEGAVAALEDRIPAKWKAQIMQAIRKTDQVGIGSLLTPTSV